MKIKRTLKYGSFGWDDETKKFTIEYAFAFLRFAFSIAQRNWFRKQEKPKILAKEICDKNIREGKFEHEQFELPNIDGKAISEDAKFFSDSLLKK